MNLTKNELAVLAALAGAVTGYYAGPMRIVMGAAVGWLLVRCSGGKAS